MSIIHQKIFKFLLKTNKLTSAPLKQIAFRTYLKNNSKDAHVEKLLEASQNSSIKQLKLGTKINIFFQAINR